MAWQGTKFGKPLRAVVTTLDEYQRQLRTLLCRRDSTFILLKLMSVALWPWSEVLFSIKRNIGLGGCRYVASSIKRQSDKIKQNDEKMAKIVDF